jgi:hypothetical protein
MTGVTTKVILLVGQRRAISDTQVAIVGFSVNGFVVTYFSIKMSLLPWLFQAIAKLKVIMLGITWLQAVVVRTGRKILILKSFHTIFLSFYIVLTRDVFLFFPNDVSSTVLVSIFPSICVIQRCKCRLKKRCG